MFQVCFKHPELLRLARDASLACKPSKVEHMDLEKDTIKAGVDILYSLNLMNGKLIYNIYVFMIFQKEGLMKPP